MLDIYFDKNYGKLYEDHEDGIAEQFVHESKHGKITNLFIKKEIPIHIHSKKYYDITTPYGYGGPVIVHTSNKEKLVKEYEQAFQEYCDENSIIAEFVRFHPIMENALDFKKTYSIEYLRNTVGTSIFESTFSNEFSKSARKALRRSLRDGLSYRIRKNPEDISSFINIYYSTMERNNASNYYYFSNNYFYKLVESFKNKIVLVDVLYENEIIASSINLSYDNLIHVHLSGTNPDYLKYSPAYVLKYALVEWAEENGYTLIHYGGGTSNDINDSLYSFKKKFTKGTFFDFYIGKKVWNQSIYNELCEIKKIDAEVEFFPAYRA